MSRSSRDITHGEAAGVGKASLAPQVRRQQSLGLESKERPARRERAAGETVNAIDGLMVDDHGNRRLRSAGKVFDRELMFVVSSAGARDTG
jgi:hypothetical protein